MSPRRNWDSPNPSPAIECALPPGQKGGGGGAHSQFRRLEKKLSTLPTLEEVFTIYLLFLQEKLERMENEMNIVSEESRELANRLEHSQRELLEKVGVQG
jgi:hypothetical protein